MWNIISFCIIFCSLFINITTSNNEITQQIESLSAFSEELLANTENTQELSNKTINGSRNINNLLDDVMKEVSILQMIIDSKDEYRIVL